MLPVLSKNFLLTTGSKEGRKCSSGNISQQISASLVYVLEVFLKECLVCSMSDRPEHVMLF